MLVNVPKLVTAYYTEVPDPQFLNRGLCSVHQGIVVPHSKGLSTNGISSPLVRPSACYREQKKIDGHLFLGMEHACTLRAGFCKRT